ncbi:MAG: hypothetical protein R3F34_14320 [Planctomycetota bacterium]
MTTESPEQERTAGPARATADGAPGADAGRTATVRRDGPGPRTAVAFEFVRALVALALVPFHLAVHLVRAGARTREVARDLGSSAEPTEVPEVEAPRSPHVFVSCAEPSGEIHATNLVRALSRLTEGRATFSGLGSEALEGLGVARVGDPVSKARMGFGVVAALPFYLRLLTDVARELRETRPDVCVMVDSPALHVPIGRIARRYGVPVVHFVTPQYWGWAPWRVGGYRRAVDLALTILPFEVPWFASRRVPCAHVGHPIVDRLATIAARDEPRDDGPIAVLPGSRASVVGRNLPFMLEVLRGMDGEKALVPVGRPDLAELVRAEVEAAGMTDRVDVAVGDLHEVLPRCRAALSVSGTVLLDLLHHRLPCAVVYRLSNALEPALAPHLLTVPHFASINLLAARAVVPEFCFAGDGPVEEVRSALAALARRGPERERCIAGLAEARLALGGPGAVERAARWTLAAASGRPLPIRVKTATASA